MHRNLDVSFVIPCFRSRHTIGRTLEAVFAQETSLCFEVIVVESSQDSTAEWIRTSFPEVTIFPAKTRLAPGAARNLGAEQAGGEYLAFLDADACPAPGWLSIMHRRLKNSPAAKIVSSAIGIDDTSSWFSWVLYWTEFSEFMPGSPSGSRSHLSSCNLMVTRDDFLAAGGFEEEYYMAEDLLLSRAFCGSLYFEGTTTVDHIFRSGWTQVSRHLKKLGYWSGRLRRQFDTTGSWLRAVPFACLLLPPVRTARIIGRVSTADLKTGVRAALYSPLIMAALWKWSTGFYRGLTDGPAPPPDE
jgi:glycosyltransferase involved in cell wall biosynthesis